MPARLGITRQNRLGKSQLDVNPLFKGLLDEFRIYDRVLSPGKILYLASQQSETAEGEVDMNQ